MTWRGFLVGEWDILKLRWTIRVLRVKLAYLRARQWLMCAQTANRERAGEDSEYPV